MLCSHDSYYMLHTTCDIHCNMYCLYCATYMRQSGNSTPVFILSKLASMSLLLLFMINLLNIRGLHEVSAWSTKVKLLNIVILHNAASLGRNTRVSGFGHFLYTAYVCHYILNAISAVGIHCCQYISGEHANWVFYKLFREEFLGRFSGKFKILSLFLDISYYYRYQSVSITIIRRTISK